MGIQSSDFVSYCDDRKQTQKIVKKIIIITIIEKSIEHSKKNILLSMSQVVTMMLHLSEICIKNIREKIYTYFMSNQPLLETSSASISVLLEYSPF